MLDKARSTDLEVAELLVCADFLKPHQLDKAYAACRDEHTPLTTILLEQNLVSPSLLVSALEVRNEVHEGKMPLSVARSVLFLMGQCELSLPDAMAKLGVVPVQNPWQHRLLALSESYQKVG